MSTGENRPSEAPAKASLPPEYQLLIEEEFRKIASRYLAGATAVLGLFALLGLTSVYVFVSQSMTSAVNTKFADIDARLDARVDQTITRERARIDKLLDEMNATALAGLRDALTFKIELGEKVKQAETLRADLEQLFRDSDRQLAGSKAKLEQFDNEVNKTVTGGVLAVAANADFRKAVADQINSEAATAIARLDKLADGRSPLNGTWVLDGEAAQPAYSLEIAKGRFLLVGRDRLWTFAAFDKDARTLRTDANGAVGWRDNSIGRVSADWKSIVWQGGEAKWTRP